MAIQIVTKEEFDEHQKLTNKKLDDIIDLINKKSTSESLISKKQLAQALGCSESTVDNMRRKGIIKAYYIGIGKRSKPAFRLSEVIQAIENNVD